MAASAHHQRPGELRLVAMPGLGSDMVTPKRAALVKMTQASSGCSLARAV